MNNTNTWELYVHFPFCVRKCNYCDFLSFPFRENPCYPNYMSHLEQDFLFELKDQKFGPFWQNNPVRSVFFGGGTPSLISSDDIGHFMKFISQQVLFTDDAEITIEANPGTFDRQKALAWKEAGINRVSVGVQTFDNGLLKRLGRIHTREEALSQIQMLSECGFDNISIDLIFGLPGQTLSQWQETLQIAASLPIRHISCYSLIVEEGTPFFEDYQKGLLNLPSEETEREMAHFAAAYLVEQEFLQYEISNFAKAGFESRHNTGYWEGIPYMGIGLGASSLSVDCKEKRCRYSKTTDFSEYCSGYKRNNMLFLSNEERMSEFAFLGLRKTAGISKRVFRELFNVPLETVFGPAIKKHLNNGLLKETPDGYALTTRGLDLANQVMEDFI